MSFRRKDLIWTWDPANRLALDHHWRLLPRSCAPRRVLCAPPPAVRPLMPSVRHPHPVRVTTAIRGLHATCSLSYDRIPPRVFDAGAHAGACSPLLEKRLEMERHERD